MPFFIIPVPTFQWKDLVGKTLEISSKRDETMVAVLGKDKDGVIYVLDVYPIPKDQH